MEAVQKQTPETLARYVDFGPERIATETVRQLAENLPAAFAIEAVRAYSMKSLPYGRYRSAWTHVEHALCRDHDASDEVREIDFDIANELLKTVVTPEKTRVTKVLNHEATVLNSYIPILKKRASGQEISRSDVTDLRLSLVAALECTLRSVDAESIPSKCSETLVEILACRTNQPGLLIYPTSPREETSPHQSLNHDCYGIGANEEKIAVQVKLISSDKKYDDDIIVLIIDDVIKKLRRKQRRLARKNGNNDSEGQSVRIENYMSLMMLVIAEAEGEELTEEEINVLNIATASVIGLLYKSYNAKDS